MDDHRLVLTDELWDEMADVLAGVKSPRGAPAALPDRDFVEAILYLALSGCPWRDLPVRFGPWSAVYNRFRRWTTRGVWAAMISRSPGPLGPIRGLLMWDRAAAPAYAHAAEAPARKRGRRRAAAVLHPV